MNSLGTPRRTRSLTDDDKLRKQPEFVGVDPKYLCPLCGLVLHSPVQTECGHRFCEKCIRDFIREEEGKGTNPVTCPATEEACQQQISSDQINPDFCAKKEISKLHVFCPYRKFGCQEKVEWRKLKDHADSCTYKGRDVKCQFCGQVIPERLLEDHHKEECLKATVVCPNNCGEAGVTRETLEHHIQICSNRPDKCPFAKHGCQFEGSGQSMSMHLKTDAVRHLELVNSNFCDIENKLAASQQENRSLKRDVQQLSSLCSDLQNKQREMAKVLATQAEKSAQLTQKCQNSASREDLDRHTREIIKVKDDITNQAGVISRIERRLVTSAGPTAPNSPELNGRLMTVDRQIGIHDVRLAEHELRFQCLETGSYNGTLIWRIDDFSKRKQEAAAGRTLSLYSQPFYSSRYGYKMCARVYLNGDGQGRNTHMSLFFVVMKGDYDNLLAWPFKQKVTMSLLDQSGGKRHLSDTFRPDPSSSSFRKPVSEMNIASGCPLFVSHPVVENPPYNVDDSVFIKVHVDTSDLTNI